MTPVIGSGPGPQEARESCTVRGNQRGTQLRLSDVRRGPGDRASSIAPKTAPQIYGRFPGAGREALTFYAEVIGGEASLHSYKEFGRNDGPADAIAQFFMSCCPVWLECGRG